MGVEPGGAPGHDLEGPVRIVVLLRAIYGVLRIVDVTQQQVGKVKQAGPRSGQHPESFLIVQLAEETELAPLLFDLIFGEVGVRGLVCPAYHFPQVERYRRQRRENHEGHHGSRAGRMRRVRTTPLETSPSRLYCVATMPVGATPLSTQRSIAERMLCSGSASGRSH